MVELCGRLLSEMQRKLTFIPTRLCLAAVLSLTCSGGEKFLRGDSVAIQMEILEETTPPYPQAAIKAGRQGLVSLEVTISSDGKVAKIMIRDAFDDGAGALAMKAVANWRYIPIPADSIAAGYPRIGPVILRYSLTPGGARVTNEAAATALQVKRRREVESKK